MLEELAMKYQTDKHQHGFCPFYEQFFGPIRERVGRMLEIGVADGDSVRMWLDYFPKAEVYGLDNELYGDRSKWPTDHPRFHPMLGDQAERAVLETVRGRGPFDIVIDDGSHTMHDQQVGLGMLWPQTLHYYVVEDLHTSFMPFIKLFDGGHVVYSYPTGIDGDELTTYELLTEFARHGEMGHSHMTDDEAKVLERTCAEVHIFEPSRQYITAVLERGC